ncbi:GNAT family N-acetyltransferase [Psychrobacillus vulpis]|uniref:GNAT family N-acetyltransferase n=2 Tax=Psychrobacillus vulpis TaxID=2325572 RepID=A0A544TVB4_9BACI|nr:GNAT family N-acetyltransferase [Psychrobacillus vulpis]TQR21389.1 GNAT family N-acetyltransferase [Psychrobacillus vulpis]
MLKEVAQWMKDSGIKQWEFLLRGGDDEEIKQAVSNNVTYIIIKDKEIIATFTLSSKQSEWDNHIFGEDRLSNSLYLHRLAITPKFMKKGIGKSILHWILENINTDKELIKLDCVANNTKLNDFYKNNGFELIGIKDGHSKFQVCIK